MRPLAFATPVLAPLTLFALLSLPGCGGKVETDGSSPPPTADGGSDAIAPSSSDGGRSDAVSPPSSDGAVPCHTSMDCPGSPSSPISDVCYGPISPESICLAAAGCTSNQDCVNYKGTVCSTGSGAEAEDGGPTCRPPCTSNGDCNYWESCQTDGTCQPLPCESCPSYLSCTGDKCGPKSCNTDADCPGAYCVDNTCFATLGTCGGACG
jgi:hypothetical protein